MAQVSRGAGISRDMEALPLQSVRCLECAEVYTKPRGRGTMASNPGCPECGYVGWLAVNVPKPNLHSAADRLQRRLAPRG